MEDDRHRRRLPLKTNHHKWNEKLREKCLKRIREDRCQLLWKMRLTSPSDPSLIPTTNTNHHNQKKIMDSTFRDIVSDELRKMKESSPNDHLKTSKSSTEVDDDAIWEYDDLRMDFHSTESEYEEIMIEMQRIFYEDLREEQNIIEQEVCESVTEEEEIACLVEAAFEHMRLNDEEVYKKAFWCPVCKQGELKEGPTLIHCTRCRLRLDRGDEVNLEYLRVRLAEAHTEHLDRGCRMTPNFSMETKFDITALYIQCQACNTFDILI